MILENNNRKFIRTLSDSCLKANRARNRIAILAILLTAILFTTVTTVTDGAGKMIKEQMLRQSGTRYMVSIKYIPGEKAEELLANENWAEAGIERTIGFVFNQELLNLSAAVSWFSENYAINCYSMPETGRLPEAANEVACDTNVLRLLGIPAELGSIVTLEYDVNGEYRTAELTLCGFWEGEENAQRANILVSETFLKQNIDETLLTDGAAAAGCYTVRGSFSSNKDIGGQLDEVLRAAGYRSEAERGEEGFVVNHISPVYQVSDAIGIGTILAAAGCVLLVLFGGYLIIYNIFQISVLKDIRLYGQLKTIGAAPKQLRYMVKRQGFLLSLYAIPAGLVIGWLLGNVLLPLVLQSTSFNKTTFLLPNILMWVIAAAFTFITVFISCSKPGKIAGNISPVEALRYQGQQIDRKKTKNGGSSKHRILSMAADNLGRSKRKTILVVLSISISIILFNSVLNITGCFDKETYIRRDIVTDFDVMNIDFYKSMDYASARVVPETFAEQIEQLQGVRDFGKAYYRAYEDETDPAAELAEITVVNGTKMAQDNEVWDNQRQMYGFDENALKVTQVIEGSIDYEALESGRYVVIGGWLSDRGRYYTERNEFHAGDKIEAVIDGKTMEFEVMAVVGIPNSLCMDYSFGGYESICFSENVFLNLFPENSNPIHCIFNAEEEAFSKINEWILENQSAFNVKVSTMLSAEQDFEELVFTYRAVGVIFAGVFGIIGILNLLNVILTGAIARQHEFAVMQSIGMTGKQLRSLFLYEGIFYAGLAGLSGVLLSGVLSFTMVKGITDGWWFAKYRFMIAPGIIAGLAGIGFAAVISAFVNRIYNKGSVVEKLLENE